MVRFCHNINTQEIKEDEYGKAKEFRLFSISRPHMRAFHSSWFCFFLAFTSWFGIQPLLPTITKELQLSKKEVANSGIASVAATIVLRIMVGPLCDKFGPRRVMSALLLSGSIPMALAGLVSNGTELIILRLFIGVLGGAFVPCQHWTSIMFNSRIVGTANALVGGWGNLGGGFTFLFMPAIFQLITMAGVNEFLAWKISVVVPALSCCVTGISILFTTDDCPQGEWRNRIHSNNDLKHQTSMLIPEEGNDNKHDKADVNDSKNDEADVNYSKNDEADDNYSKNDEADVNYSKNDEADDNENQNGFWTIITLLILILQYGMCFGVEIATNTVINLYLLYKFKIKGCNETSVSITDINGTEITSSNTDDLSCSILNQNTASLIASLFGLMNIFARAVGGVFSDILYKKLHFPGRLVAHQICMAGEGFMLIVFSRMTSIPSAIIALVITSLFVQASEGTTFAIVPSVNRKRVGLIAGFVGAGGNAGAIMWNTMWVHFVDTNPSKWFCILGIIVLCGSSLTVLVRVEGNTIWNLCCNNNNCDKDENKTELTGSHIQKHII